MDEKKVHILVIHGPNLNMLGVREPEIYGTRTLNQINGEIVANDKVKGADVVFFQSNYEGAIIETIQGALGIYDGIVINPAAYTHYSIAIRDAIAGVGIPTVEVHLSCINEREAFRRISVIKDVCICQISGKGVQSYIEGIEVLLEGKKSCN
ncbi:MAG: type II 3-dehydroquinate dehydratase [Anaerovorax sp.]